MTSEILIARHGFKGTNDNELTFKKGARITLISLDESGWAQVKGINKLNSIYLFVIFIE